MSAGQVLLIVLAAYGAIGVLVSLPLVLGGMARINASAAAAPLRVRLLFFPGSVALWPLMAAKWASGGRPPAEPHAPIEPLVRRHAYTWLFLGPALLVGLALLVAARPRPAGDGPASLTPAAQEPGP